MVGLAGCGGSETSSSARDLQDAGIPEAGSVSADQRAYFEDGVVTLAEYQEAFSRFVECAAGAGGVVSESARNPVTGLISYTSSALLQAEGAQVLDADGNVLPTVSNPVNDCYQRFFDVTEIAFTANDPTVQAAIPSEQMAAFEQVVKPCLLANGVEVPVDLEFGSSQYRDLTDRAAELNASGSCGQGSPSSVATEP